MREFYRAHEITVVRLSCNEAIVVARYDLDIAARAVPDR
jgi:hypothetical protein